MKTKSKIITLIACIALFISCAKDGETGPQGATGAQGAQGATGAQGPGATSQTVTTTAGQWSHIGTAGSSGDGWETVQSFSIITASIISTGAVVVYVSDNTSTWYAIPCSVPYSSWTRSWNYHYQVGQVTYDMQDSDFTTPQPGTAYLKVVVIPGRIMQQHHEVDLNNYEQVKAVFNLQD